MEETNYCVFYLILGIALGASTGLMGVPIKELKWNWAKTAWLILVAMLVALLYYATT